MLKQYGFFNGLSSGFSPAERFFQQRPTGRADTSGRLPVHYVLIFKFKININKVSYLTRCVKNIISSGEKITLVKFLLIWQEFCI